jgi:hypothetical protein
VAESIATHATASTTLLAKLHTCASSVTTATEESCARMIATSLAPRAYRRTVATTEIDELVALYKGVRALATTMTFGSGVAAMIEGMLQAPEFLYRVELGKAVAGNPAVMRVAGREMATRLSYMLWQTMPDAALFQAADAGTLDTADGVRQQAQKLLDDPKSHPTVAFFFDNLLPIPDLSGLTRDAGTFPKWSSSIGVAMRSEVQRVLEYEIFEDTTQVAAPYAPGSWPAILTAPYTYVNQALFNYYGASTFAPGTAAPTGTALTKVDLNTSQRLGLMTLGGMAAGSSTSLRTRSSAGWGGSMRCSCSFRVSSTVSRTCGSTSQRTSLAGSHASSEVRTNGTSATLAGLRSSSACRRSSAARASTSRSTSTSGS